MNEADLTAKLQQEMTADKILFFCDLVGGTPYKTAVKLSFNTADKMAVVAGCNIGALLELGLNQNGLDQQSIKTIADQFVQVSQAGTQVFKHHQIVEPETDEDGI
jgi:PTS system N-acetylgalactosamine-specific IIA component